MHTITTKNLDQNRELIAILSKNRPLEEMLFLLARFGGQVRVCAPDECSRNLAIFVYERAASESFEEPASDRYLVGSHLYSEEEVRRQWKWLPIKEEPVCMADQDLCCADPEWLAKRNKRYRIKWDVENDFGYGEGQDVQIGVASAFVPLVLMYAYASMGMALISFPCKVYSCEKFFGGAICLNLTLLSENEIIGGWQESVLIPLERLDAKYAVQFGEITSLARENAELRKN